MHQLQFLLHKQHFSLTGLCHDLLFHAVSVFKSSLSAFSPILCPKGVITWYWGDICAGVSSLQFSLMALNLFTWYHSVSSPRLLYRRENFSRKVHVFENEIVPYENVIFKHFISLCYKLILSSIKIRHLFTLCKAKYR